MTTGCTDIAAINFNKEATLDDKSCIYLFKRDGDCLMFRDVPEDDLKDQSFTMSWSLTNSNWVFFHDYLPQIYFHTRQQLWATYAQEIYKFNTGPYGVFMNPDISSFFVDIAFSTGEDTLLESVNWITEVLTGSVDNHDALTEFLTFTHISIWNSQQHTGRIDLNTTNYRKTKGTWNLHDFRNTLLERGTQFLFDIFNNYALDITKQGEKAWYEQEIMQDKFHIVRFEFDNLANKQLIVHNLGAQVLNSDR